MGENVAAKVFEIKPIEHIYDMTSAPIHMMPLAADWPSINMMVNAKRVTKRWGYTQYRDFGSSAQGYGILLYQRSDGSAETLVFTDKDLCKIETATSKTFSYVTETTTYTLTAQVDEIDAATKLVVTFEGAATLQTDGVAAGDIFVLDEDLTSDEEDDTAWRVIASVDSETQLTLSTAYGKAVATPGAKDARIRHIYSLNTDQRPVWAIAGDKLCFTHDNMNVQYYDGTTFAADLDSTNAINARYLLSYARRLFLAHLFEVKAPGTVTFTGTGLDDLTAGGASKNTSALNYKIEIDGTGTPNTFKWSDDGGSTWDATTVSITAVAQNLNNNVTVTFAAGTGHTSGDYWEFSTAAAIHNPWLLQHSAINDPTDFSGATAGQIEFMETTDPITGLGAVGPNMIVYRERGFVIGVRTGVSTAPVDFRGKREGTGLWAPYSLVHFQGTNAFRGRDDFYVIEGDRAVAIGDRIRHKFNDIVSDAEKKNVVGVNNPFESEVLWTVSTKEGRFTFAWDWKDKEWSVYEYKIDIHAMGEGGA